MSFSKDRKLVLAPVDGTPHSREVLARAARVAASRGVDLDVIHVMRPIDLSSSPGLDEVCRFDRRIVAAERWLEDWVRPFRRDGLKVQVRVLLHEDPAQAIVEEARHSGPGVVVMGSRGRPWWSRLLLGSVAHAVVRDCPCPVLVVRADHESFLRLAS